MAELRARLSSQQLQESDGRESADRLAERVTELTASVARKDGHIRELRARIEQQGKECDERAQGQEQTDKMRAQLKKAKV